MKTLISLLLFCFLATGLTAHPPSKVILNYDAKNKSLKIDINHKVSSTEDHFIKTVTIKVNGQEVETRTFTKQTSSEHEILIVELPDTKENDEITVTATCNKMGKKSAVLKVKTYFDQKNK